MYQPGPDDKQQTRLNINFPHLLLVEGRDDGWFYEMACRFAGVADKIEIRSIGDNSGTAFQGAIRFLVEAASHLQTIAIIRDAEENPATTWISACDALERGGLPRPLQHGNLSPIQSDRQAAALIVPDLNTPGSMETICWLSLKGHPLATCVEDFRACAWACDPTLEPSTQALKDKTRIRAFLAVGTNIPHPVEPGKRFIEVTREGKLWDWNDPAFAPIIDFVKTVARVP